MSAPVTPGGGWFTVAILAAAPVYIAVHIVVAVVMAVVS